MPPKNAISRKDSIDSINVGSEFSDDGPIAQPRARGLSSASAAPSSAGPAPLRRPPSLERVNSGGSMGSGSQAAIITASLGRLGRQNTGLTAREEESQAKIRKELAADAHDKEESEQERQQREKEEREKKLKIAKMTKSEQLLHAVENREVETVAELLRLSAEARKAAKYFSSNDGKEASDQWCEINYREPGVGSTAMHKACKAGMYNIMRELLKDEKIDVNCTDHYGYTPLMLAAQNGHLLICDYLLPDEFGRREMREAAGVADDDEDDEKKKKLKENARQKDKDSEKKDVAHVYLSDIDGWTAAMFAAEKGHKLVVEFLQKRKADLGIQSRAGETPLMKAAANGHLNVVKFLVSKEVDITATNREGNSALFLAAYFGQLEVVYYLAYKMKDEELDKTKNKANETINDMLPSSFAVQNYQQLPYWWPPVPPDPVHQSMAVIKTDEEEEKDPHEVYRTAYEEFEPPKRLPFNEFQARKDIRELVRRVITHVKAMHRYVAKRDKEKLESIVWRGKEPDDPEDILKPRDSGEVQEVQKMIDLLEKGDALRAMAQENTDNKEFYAANCLYRLAMKAFEEGVKLMDRFVTAGRGSEEVERRKRKQLEFDFEGRLRKTKESEGTAKEYAKRYKDKKRKLQQQMEMRKEEQTKIRFAAGEKYMEQKKYVDAAKAFRQARDDDPDNETYVRAYNEARAKAREKSKPTEATRKEMAERSCSLFCGASRK